MRLSVTGSVLVMAAGCGGGGNGGVECITNANCDLQAGGVCVEAPSGKLWCAYPDTSCASGLRWADADVGDGLAGTCVDVDNPDAGGPDAATPDGMVDAMPGTWTNPSEVANISGGDDNGYHSPSISDDGLSLYYSVYQTGSNREVYVVTRAAVGLPFDNPTEVSVVNSADHDMDANVAPNHRELVIDRNPTATLNHNLYASERGSTASAWGTPTSLGFQGRSPAVSGDGLALYYLHPTDLTLHKRTRTSLVAAWGSEINVAITDAPAYYNDMDISSDQLSLLLSYRNGSSGPLLVECTRAAVGDAFADCTEMPIMPPFVTAGGGSLTGAEWNAEGTEIYFSGQSATVMRIYVSTYVQ